MRVAFAWVGGFALLLLVIFALDLFGFGSYAFFAPKYTAVQNKVFQESQQYNEGMVRDLENIQRQYVAATPEQRRALKALALHRFEVYPIDRMPPDLQNFYRSLEQ